MSSSSNVSDLAINQTQSLVQSVLDSPKQAFGKVFRLYQNRWFQLYPWLEYSVLRDAAFCYACRHFHNNPEATFTTVGYQDWKHALGIRGVFTLHGKSKVHEEAMLNWAEFKRRIPAEASIGMHLDRMGMQQIENNRKYVEVRCSQQGKVLEPMMRVRMRAC